MNERPTSGYFLLSFTDVAGEQRGAVLTQTLPLAVCLHENITWITVETNMCSIRRRRTLVTTRVKAVMS